VGAGGSRLRLQNAPSGSAAARSAGFEILRDVFPGTDAPGFMLTCAPRTQYGQSSM